MSMLLRLLGLVSLYVLAVAVGAALAALIDGTSQHEIRSVSVAGILGWGGGIAEALGALVSPFMSGVASMMAGPGEAATEVSAQVGLFALLGLMLFWPWLRSDLYAGQLQITLFTALFMGLFVMAAVTIAALSPWPGDEFTRAVIIAAFVGLPFVGLSIANVGRLLAQGEPAKDAFSQGWERFIAGFVYFTLALALFAGVTMNTSSDGLAFALTLSFMLVLIGGVEVHSSMYRGIQRGFHISAGLAVIAAPLSTFAMYVVDWMIFIEMLPGTVSQ